MNKGKITLTVVAVGTVLASAARVFAVSRTDMSSGFIVRGSEMLCNALYFGAILLTAAVCAALWIKDRDSDVSGFSGRGAVFAGFGLLAVAICSAYDGFDELSALSPSGFHMFADFFFAALFCIVAFITLYLKEFKPFVGFMYVFGGLYCVLRGVFCFNEKMVVTAVPEYLINCLLAIGGAVFFLMAARVFSGNTGKLTKAALFGWGAGTCVTAVSAYLGTGLAKLLLAPEISERIVFSQNSAEFFYQSLHGRDAYQLAFPPLPDAAVGFFALAVLAAVGFARRSDQ